MNSRLESFKDYAVHSLPDFIWQKAKKGVRKSSSSIKKKAPRAARIVRHSSGPAEVKDKFAEEARDELGDLARDQMKKQWQAKASHFSERLQEKTEKNAENIHSRAQEAKERVQDKFIDVQDQLASVKGMGEGLQEKVSGTKGRKKMKTAHDLKGAAHIKSSAHIKGAKDVKKLSDIKTIRS